MAIYLLTWNPVKWERVDPRECVGETKRKGFYLSGRSCGNNKRIAKGDRAFLLRQGLEPRGVCGSGYADSEVYEDVPRWVALPHGSPFPAAPLLM